jgi:type IV pilus assembly protein PilM
MKLPSHPFVQLETLSSNLLHANFLGIDVGTSSLKIVQLSAEDKTIVLDTYGEIELAPYDDREPGKSVHLDAQKQSAALMDLLHTVGATARIGGIAIPFSSSLISFVKVPERDPEQMKIIVPAEAKLYVPIPMERVVLDWMVVSENVPEEDAFARAESKKPARSGTQDLMLVAIEKTTAAAYEATMTTSGLAADFYEVELFGAARAAIKPGDGPAFLIDIGASTSKLSAINGRGIPVAVHPVLAGGQLMTESIMSACGWSLEKAEAAKRTAGLLGADTFSKDENAKIKKACMAVLTQVFAEASRIIAEAANDHDVDARRVLLLGGGALLPGLVEAATKHFETGAMRADPFTHIRAPIILQDVLHEVGPKFAVAMGLALRGIQSR